MKVRLNFEMFAVLGVLFIMLTACKAEQQDIPARLSPDQTYHLRVMYYSENSFMTSFGQYFLQKFPNVNIHVIPVPKYKADLTLEQIVVNHVAEHQPDVLLIGDPGAYNGLIQQKMLLSLDDLIRRDLFPIDDYYPPVMEKLRHSDLGALFGLAPVFGTMALYFNHDLFQEYDLDVPQHPLDWNQLLELASRFRSSSKTLPQTEIVGLYLPDYSRFYDLISHIGALERLPMLSTDGSRMMLTTDERWTSIWRLLYEGIRSDTLRFSQALSADLVQHAMSDDLFADGHAAMAILSEGYLNRMSEKQEFRWGIVSEPAHAVYPKLTRSINLYEFYAINANTEMVDPAWELVKFIHSEEMSRIRFRDGLYQLPSRKTDLKLAHDPQLYEPFYMFEGLIPPVLESVTSTFFSELARFAEEQFKEALVQKDDIDEIISKINQYGDSLLLQAGQLDKKNDQ